MYCCYNPRRLRLFLLIDIVILMLWMLWTAVGNASAHMPRPDGIFLPVIMYHSVTETASSNYQITPEIFENDLRYLKLQGYETVSAAQLYAYTEGKGELPAHPVTLTFDNGFYNNLSIVHPLLEQYDMCAVVSIVGEYTEVTAERDPHVDRYSYLTWDDVRQSQDSGRVEIGNHTWDLHSNDTRAGCSILYGEDASVYQEMLREDVGKVQSHAYKNRILPDSIRLSIRLHLSGKHSGSQRAWLHLHADMLRKTKLYHQRQRLSLWTVPLQPQSVPHHRGFLC